ncbi:MAG: hypothetical protein ABI837_06020 [Acidobacteriota bacterium]
MRTISAALATLLCSIFVPASAAEVLFPTPLHLTRQVHDPISDSTATLDEYAYGNRLISVRGDRTAIADYEKGELTEIDRTAGTYSVTRFDVVAKAARPSGPTAAASPLTSDSQATKPPLKALGAKATKSGHQGDFYSAEVGTQNAKQRVDVGVDHSIMVSRPALEVLLGAAYPGTRLPEHEVILAAAAPGRALATASTDSSTRAASYALPLEQLVTYDFDGKQVEFRSTVVRVGNEPAPMDLIAIPAGARRVESRTVLISREIESIEHPVVPSRSH